MPPWLQDSEWEDVGLWPRHGSPPQRYQRKERGSNDGVSCGNQSDGEGRF